MLTRELPFVGGNLLAVLHNLHFGAPKDIRYLRPDLPPNLVTVVGRCLQKQPADRYQSAAEIPRFARRIVVSLVGFWICALAPPRQRIAAEPRSARRDPGSRNSGGHAVPTLLAACRFVRGLGAAGGCSGCFRIAPPGQFLPKQAPDNTPGVQPCGCRYSLRPAHAGAGLPERWDLADNVDRSIAMLNRAIELDPNYAPAYASLAVAY